MTPTLQTLLYGQFTPPLVSKVHRHNLLQCEGKPLPRYDGKTAPRYICKHPIPEAQLQSAQNMYQYIKKNPGVTTRALQQELKLSTSYTYRLRDILISQNKIYGVRGKPRQMGGLTGMAFYVKD